MAAGVSLLERWHDRHSRAVLEGLDPEEAVYVADTDSPCTADVALVAVRRRFAPGAYVEALPATFAEAVEFRAVDAQGGSVYWWDPERGLRWIADWHPPASVRGQVRRPSISGGVKEVYG